MQRGQRAHPGVRHELPRPWVGVGGLHDPGLQGLDVRVEPRQQLEALVAPLGRVRRQRQRLQLRSPAAREQRTACREPVIQGDGVYPIFHHGAHPDEPHAMSHEHPQVAYCRIRHPDDGEPILPEQLQQVGGVAPVGLGFADHHGANLRRIADQQRMALALQHRVKPQRVAGALDPDGDGARQRGIEAFDGVAFVSKSKFLHLPRLGVEDSYLLIPTVQVTSNECHDTALL